MGSGIFDFALGEDIGNLRRSISVHAQLENLTNYLGGSIVHDPMVLIVRVFGISVWRLGTQRFAGFALCLEHRTNFLTGVLGVKFVENVDKRSKITVLLIGAVHAIVDGNEANICAGKGYLSVKTDLEVVSSQSARVLYNDRTDLAFAHKGHKALPIRSVEGSPTVAIVNEKDRVSEAIVISELLEDSLLVKDGVAIPLKFIVTGKAAIQSRDFIRRNS